jgi:hypothetical protein
MNKNDGIRSERQGHSMANDAWWESSLRKSEAMSIKSQLPAGFEGRDGGSQFVLSVRRSILCAREVCLTIARDNRITAGARCHKAGDNLLRQSVLLSSARAHRVGASENHAATLQREAGRGAMGAAIPEPPRVTMARLVPGPIRAIKKHRTPNCLTDVDTAPAGSRSSARNGEAGREMWRSDERHCWRICS